jgi:limonene-1,2-epoxide hydrolase
LTVDGDLINRSELFDEADLEAALVRFEELSRPATTLANAASRAYDRFNGYFSACDWTAAAEAMAEGMCDDDRRRVVSAGVRRGRDGVIANLRTAADLGARNIASAGIATRGDRLALCRLSLAGLGPEAFHTEVLGVVEVDVDDRIVAHVMFDPDDFDAAVAELDARYLASEAAVHTHTWSLIARTFAAINQKEISPTTPDWVGIDHRHGIASAPGEMIRYIRSVWDVSPDIKTYAEAVHRLSDLGAVVTHAAHGTSLRGFDAEWRETILFTFEDDLISRCEIFDEADLDTALAKFDELARPALTLENAASRIVQRLGACFVDHDWHALADTLAEDVSTDDRRRVVGAGIRHGRDAEIASMRATAEVGTKSMTGTVVATRGNHLVLSRFRFSGRQQGAEEFLVEVLGVIETNADDRIGAVVVFESDDVDAAFSELDARYLAGEVSAHSHTWSVIARGIAAFNGRELPGFTPDSVNIDHRRARGFAPGDLTAYIGATWDLAPDVSAYAMAVHRLSNLGAVWTHAVSGTSQDGFDAEWREICLATVEGDLINRIEMFEAEDIDDALARFDELNRPAHRLENAASRMYYRFNGYLMARDWDAMAEMIGDDICNDDRRRVVSSGVLRGRGAQTANLRAVVDVGVKNFESVVIATRGERVALMRTCVSGGQLPEAFGLELLTIIEIDSDNRISWGIQFDLEDIDAAFAELDARYLAGEAAAHPGTWSAIADHYAGFNRDGDVPDWVIVDHRRRSLFASGDLDPAIRGSRDITPNLSIHVEAVHTVSAYGAVVTNVASGTSNAGFDAEWRMVEIFGVEDGLVTRLEIFDEVDLDAALARFDELSGPAPRLGNAACRAGDRYLEQFAAHDWNAMAEMLAEDFSSDDRRRVVGAGVRLGRDAEIASMRAISNVGLTNARQSCFAERGGRLTLSRIRFSGRDHSTEAVVIDALSVVEIKADNRIAATVVFDVEDIDAAFAELDARYLAGEASEYAHTWSMVTACYTSLNRREMPPTTPDFIDADHRRVTAMAPGDIFDFVRASWKQIPDISFRIEAVHRLNDRGAVVTHALQGTSQEGFEAEWRGIHLMTVEGDQFNHTELFDEADLDAALARFDELNRQAP